MSFKKKTKHKKGKKCRYLCFRKQSKKKMSAQDQEKEEEDAVQNKEIVRSYVKTKCKGHLKAAEKWTPIQKQILSFGQKHRVVIQLSGEELMKRVMRRGYGEDHIRVWKATDAHGACRGGYKYRLGKTRVHKGSVNICKSGLHSTFDPLMALAYGTASLFQPRLFRGLAAGAHQISDLHGDKLVSSRLTLEEELTPDFVDYEKLTSGIYIHTGFETGTVFLRGIRQDFFTHVIRRNARLRDALIAMATAIINP